jgi:hypothetical protein
MGPAKLERLYPLVPLFARQSVGIALVTYDGGLYVGLNADRRSFPHFHCPRRVSRRRRTRDRRAHELNGALRRRTAP